MSTAQLLAYVLVVSLQFGVNPQAVSCTIQGESEWITYAENGPNKGIAQINEKTWAWWAPMAEKDLGYLPTNPYDARQSIDLMIWAFSTGHADHWQVFREQCAYLDTGIALVRLMPPLNAVPQPY